SLGGLGVAFLDLLFKEIDGFPTVLTRGPSSEPLCLRKLDDGARPTNRRPRRFQYLHSTCLHSIDEANTIILGPDCLEPMPHIAPEHERIRGRRPALLLVGHEVRKWNGSEIHLLGSHFNELWDGNLDRVRYPLEVGRGGRFVPFEEIRIVDKILN